MFRKKEILAGIIQPETIVGQGVHLEGILEAKGIIQINGTFTGEVRTESDVIVSKEGKVEGPIFAKDLTVGGEIWGDINVRGEVVVLETGKITGNIICQTLVVKKGGIISGRITMHKEEKIKPTYEL